MTASLRSLQSQYIPDREIHPISKLGTDRLAIGSVLRVARGRYLQDLILLDLGLDIYMGRDLPALLIADRLTRDYLGCSEVSICPVTGDCAVSLRIAV
jgi:hypothetical protein